MPKKTNSAYLWQLNGLYKPPPCPHVGVDGVAWGFGFLAFVMPQDDGGWFRQSVPPTGNTSDWLVGWLDGADEVRRYALRAAASASEIKLLSDAKYKWRSEGYT